MRPITTRDLLITLLLPLLSLNLPHTILAQDFGSSLGGGGGANPFSTGGAGGSIGSGGGARGFDGLTGRGPGQGQRPRITAANLKDIDWMEIDRRDEEGWRHLYHFGESAYDTDMLGRPWNDQQIDLDFFFPYYGFRFNYSFIFPEGFIAFSYPQYIQPPYTFPNPRWPESPDSSLIAAFMTDQIPMSVGDTRISHVWFRVIHRPPNLVGIVDTDDNALNRGQNPQGNRGLAFTANGLPARYYNGQLLRTQEGRLEDPAFLDQLTQDIHHAMVGARGFTADYALVITWERMGYGGAPKVTRLNLYDQVKRWQNTYQMVIATDEIRSYVMFNYANINWTSSTSAGALFGRGGKQSALVGFNGGNGTGFMELPYSAEGNSFKLVQFGSTQTAGRWISRVDEQILYGGCTNDTVTNQRDYADLKVSQWSLSMLGGVALNVSGPCFRPSDVIKMQIDELTINCERIDMVVARCVVPVNSQYRTGVVDCKLSQDGGQSYPFWTQVYIHNNWRNPTAQELTVRWDHRNITIDRNKKVDIVLYGYWEDVAGHALTEVGSIIRGTENDGEYVFQPTQLQYTDMLWDSWKLYHGGVIQVRISDDKWLADRGDGLYWSTPIPFGWYMYRYWQEEYGENWALDMCIEWFDYDGRRENFIMELEKKHACPCVMDQAVADFGRFAPLYNCDAFGDSYCLYAQGATHCVVSTTSVWTGSGQVCCYGPEGFLMFSDDYEWNAQYLRFYGAGVPYRAHPWGAAPYKRPPYVPTMSNFYNDLMPFHFCCQYSGHCEFYYWRRQSSGCQLYRPPATAFMYGQGHVITFDNIRYTFNGKGFFVLTSMKSPNHDLMVQVRMEQPPKTDWDANVPATVITGVAASDNGSAIVEVYARKNFRRWRYRTDVYVGGRRVFFDAPHKKLLQFPGVNLRSPARNMDMSTIEIMFETGVGVMVEESRGLLTVKVALPPTYNQTYAHQRYDRYGEALPQPAMGGNDCSNYHRTMGLLGTWNSDPQDDLMTPECQSNRISQPPTASDQRNVYVNFGQRWRADGVQHDVLFDTKFSALYQPAEFAEFESFLPLFDLETMSANRTFYESLVFQREEVRVACQGVSTCEFDYITSGRREIGMDTLNFEKGFLRNKASGEQILISCGPLWKGPGVLKNPPVDNYMDGVTVTFQCKPDFFLHGEQQRTCVNGTWTPGWWVWCRSRSFEYFLKWLVGLGTSLIIIMIIAIIFLALYCKRRSKGNGQRRQRYPPAGMRGPGGLPPGQPPNMQPAPMQMSYDQKMPPPNMSGSQDGVMIKPSMTPVHHGSGMLHNESNFGGQGGPPSQMGGAPVPVMESEPGARYHMSAI